MLLLVPTGSLELLLPGATSRSALNVVERGFVRIPKHFHPMECGINQTHLGNGPWINKGPVGWWCDTALELFHTAGIQEGKDYIIQRQQPFYKSAAFLTLISVSVQTVRDVSPSRDPAAQSSSSAI